MQKKQVLECEKLKLYIRTFFSIILRVVKYWKRLPRVAMESSSQEVFKMTGHGPEQPGLILLWARRFC